MGRFTFQSPVCNIETMLLNRQLNRQTFVIPDLIRDPVSTWIALKLHCLPGFRRNDVCCFRCRVNNHRQFICLPKSTAC